MRSSSWEYRLLSRRAIGVKGRDGSSSDACPLMPPPPPGAPLRPWCRALHARTRCSREMRQRRGSSEQRARARVPCAMASAMRERVRVHDIRLLACPLARRPGIEQRASCRLRPPPWERPVWRWGSALLGRVFSRAPSPTPKLSLILETVDDGFDHSGARPQAASCWLPGPAAHHAQSNLAERVGAWTCDCARLGGIK